ncbi:MAG TPA: two-component regulator propeller domain-containing protein [Prolixibacteraceae bacterium]|nr:two-component regulator propeller domain-containing protein [Prolixibacteraceae bacterium]
MRRFYLFILVFILPFQFGWAQRAPGNWEYHLSMTNTSKVVEAGNKIYFLSDGGIFYFNKEDNSLETITKLDGLSGSDFSLISYNESMKCIIVAYKNSAIDVIYSDGSIHPIFDIKRKNIIGDKLIYSGTNVGNLCYLSCGFGIVVLDLEKLEIKDSYIIGDGGNYQTVYGIGFIDDFVFAGTKEGIKYAPASGANLLDYSNWKNVENAFLGDYNYNLITTGWGRLWAVHQSEEWHGDRTVSRHAADVWYPEYEDYSVIHDLEFTHGNMVYCLENSVVVYNSQRQKSLVIDNYPFASESVEMKPLSAIVDTLGAVWIADGNYGAVRYENGTFTPLSPDGPFNNNVFSLTFSDNQLWSASGGHSSAWEQLYSDFNVNNYSNGQWESYNRFTGAIDAGYWDAIQVLPFPGETDHCYVATWGHGILELNNGKVVNVYDDNNSSSTLQSAIPGEPYVRVGGMDFDSNGNLWVSNSKVYNNLHEMKADGTWEPYFLSEIANSFEVGQVMVTSNDDIWMIVPRKMTYGMYVMSNDGKQKKLLNVSSYFSNGEDEKITDMNNVYSMAEDKDGAIWVGTSTGIAVYNNPDNVFDTSPFYANQPGMILMMAFIIPCSRILR